MQEFCGFPLMVCNLARIRVGFGAVHEFCAVSVPLVQQLRNAAEHKVGVPVLVVFVDVRLALALFSVCFVIEYTESWDRQTNIEERLTYIQVHDDGSPNPSHLLLEVLVVPSLACGRLFGLCCGFDFGHFFGGVARVGVCLFK